jgi:hypothetical protein
MRVLSSKSHVCVYNACFISSSGVLLAQEPVRALSRVAGMGWSDLETLACVHEDGTCIVYDLFAQVLAQVLLLGLDIGACQVDLKGASPIAHVAKIPLSTSAYTCSAPMPSSYSCSARQD